MLCELIQKAIHEFGSNSFVGIRQATLYAIQYCTKSNSTEVKWLKIERVTLKNASIEIQISKRQRCFIYPYSVQNKGKMCPVSLIVCYLYLRRMLGHNSDNDYLFPNVCSKFEKVLLTHEVTIQIPQTPITYNNYWSRPKKHLNDETLKEMGVSATDYSTHSFRRGG